MKDIKNILIVVLLAGCMIFGYMWFFRNDGGYKQKIKDLEREKKELIIAREKLEKDVVVLEKNFEDLKKKESSLAADIKKRDEEIRRRKEEAAKSRAELDNMKKGLKETQEKIVELKKNPSNRTGDDLLNSLKLKTQKL
jgi:outer membrane murein-binding lipoprotein Lpp